MGGPNFLTVKEALRQIREGALESEELQQACLQQIGRLNPHLNAFITIVDSSGSEDRPSGTPQPASTGSLAAIPIAVKDMIDTANLRTTAGSLFFKERVPATDAVIVSKLKQAGACIIGKTNTHEIALGVTSANPHFGSCLNPWDNSRIPGGSSGGSAVAVATGMALAALGTDTGGSIRIPASLCGVVGLKPTYGRVSLRGIFPLSWNLDHAGPLTRSVEDAALMLQIIAGFDSEDSGSVDAPIDDYHAHLEDGIRGWRVAFGTGEYVERADAETLKAVELGAKVLSATGAEVRPVEITFLKQAALANGLMVQADGATYHRQRLADHPDWFGDDVRLRLESGRDLPVADYVQARQTQTEFKRRLAGLFEDYEILLLPSTPSSAPPSMGGDAVEQARRLTRFTAPFNLAGFPAISVPCGFDSRGLPMGLQMVAGAWREADLLQAARAYERETNWARRLPPDSR